MLRGYLGRFNGAMDDDFNVPESHRCIVWTVARDSDKTKAQQAAEPKLKRRTFRRGIT